MNERDAPGSGAIPVEAAVPAALAAGADVGLPTGDPVVVHATNNVLVRLLPAAVLAKVSRSAATARRELELAQHCVSRGAPVAAPADEVEPRVYGAVGLTVTFWRYYEALDTEADAQELGRALARLHAALTSADVAAPPVADRIAVVNATLTDDRQMVALDEPRRNALRSVMRRLDEELTPFLASGRHVLHGEPHRGNVLVTNAGPRFCDLETVMRGPLEWDLAYLPAESLGCFTGIDVALVERIRALLSAHVATFCWAKLRTLDDGNERWHAEHHLRQTLERASS